jgi:hypothetical protein
VKDIESKASLLRRLDEINMNPRDRSQAKANLVKAELLADFLFRVTRNVKGLSNRLLVQPIRRGLALIS